MKKYKHLLVAIFISPFIGIFVITFKTITLPMLLSLQGVLESLMSLLVTSVVGGIIIGIPWSLCFGLPVYILLKKINNETLWLYGVIGFIGGGLSLLGLVVDKAEHFSQALLPAYLLYSLYGLSVSLVFWYFSVYLRNQHAKSSNNALQRDTEKDAAP